MGLASYGTVHEDWLPDFIDFYKSGPQGRRVNDEKMDYEIKLDVLGEKIGVKFDEINRFEGQLAWDIAATSQRAFEECFLEFAKPFIDEYSNLPICVAGGCGLNILLNTRIKQQFNKDVFVGPNPNDCGIAAGALLHYIKPQKQVTLTYSGLPLLDLDSLAHYINEKYFFKSSFFNIENFTTDLNDGKIIGVARGRSEHGPRALGNRSILCNPTIPNMKDTLNQKVKHREWYRPFAPVVRLEDVSKYFEWEGDSQWMSFCPKVREEWKEKLVAITHIDGTARIQTVTKEQNEWLYNILTEFEKKSGVGVLLNTSFNVAGKPILSTLKDAFKIFEESQMDCLLIEEHYFKK
jgi:carbamoyltransferase